MPGPLNTPQMSSQDMFTMNLVVIKSRFYDTAIQICTRINRDEITRSCKNRGAIHLRTTDDLLNAWNEIATPRRDLNVGRLCVFWFYLDSCPIDHRQKNTIRGAIILRDWNCLPKTIDVFKFFLYCVILQSLRILLRIQTALIDVLF